MKKLALTVMAVFFVAALVTSASAHGWGRGPGYGPCVQGGVEGAAGLNLTPEQQTKLKEMREAHWKEVNPLREKMFAKRDELRKLWLEPNPDQAKIADAQKEMRSLRDQMQDRMTAFRLEAMKQLTPEQQEKLRTAYSERGRGRGPGKGPGKGPGMGPGMWGGKGGSLDFCPAVAR